MFACLSIRFRIGSVERGRLAGASLGAAHDVQPGQYDRDALRLDRRRLHSRRRSLRGRIGSARFSLANDAVAGVRCAGGLLRLRRYDLCIDGSISVGWCSLGVVEFGDRLIDEFICHCPNFMRFLRRSNGKFCCANPHQIVVMDSSFHLKRPFDLGFNHKSQ